ncbi:MAG TPA: hypothetical protein VJ836_03595 [Candidatus Saccharimonadales bacterium]|nr:hypothetical protein [Candidatus Saccharimonadales bacterium]
MQKSLYKIAEDLSPAEFGCIVDGTVDYKELVAEIVLLSLQGQVTFAKGPSGKFRVVKTYSTSARLTPIQRAILKGLDGDTRLYELLPTIRYEATQSLVRKGWIVSKKKPLRGLSSLPGRYVLYASCIGIACAAVATLIAVAMQASGVAIYMTAVLTLTIEVILALIAGLIVVFRGEMIHNAQFIMAATTKYTQDWKNVYGVYEYIRVSGMDIFTPDYETLDFKGLDPLYPYAVAAGLDKKILSAFA